MFFEWPTQQDWQIIVDRYPFQEVSLIQKLEASLKDLGRARAAGSTYWTTRLAIQTSIEFELGDWVLHLKSRLAHTRRSYVMLMFYFEKGIPDDEWQISPGRKGQSVEYFPHFQEKDHWNKTQFDYYADGFFYRLFSAWDTLAHILNIVYELEVEKADFKKVYRELKTYKPELYETLKNEVVDKCDYKKARRLRHDITHNFLPGHIGSSVTRSQSNEGETICLGAGTYTRSKEIKDSVIKSLELFAETLTIVCEQIHADSLIPESNSDTA